MRGVLECAVVYDILVYNDREVVFCQVGVAVVGVAVVGVVLVYQECYDMDL